MSEQPYSHLHFPNVWTTTTGNLALVISPKAGCSTLAQFLYYSQAGRYSEAEIHDEHLEIQKWPHGDRDFIRRKVMAIETIVVSTVRNPYRRLLSAFMDKIATHVSTRFNSANHPTHFYRGSQLNSWREKYGFGPCDSKDQIQVFERFLECLWNVSQEPEPTQSAFWDEHWTPLFPAIEDFIQKRGRIDHLIRCEDLTLGLRELAWQARLEKVPDLIQMPRFNPARVQKAFPEQTYFRSPAAQEIVQEIFWDDFQAFEYPLSPNEMHESLPPINLRRLHELCAS